MFEVGQMVVCVDDSPSRMFGKQLPIIRGRIYSVRGHCGIAHTADDGLEGIWLEEVTISQGLANHSNRPGHEPCFNGDRFRPIRDQSIEIFREITNGVKQPEKERV